MIPGEYFTAPGNITCNVARDTIELTVVNKGDRPIQVGSHFHFFEVNKQMEFDRKLSFGMRLNVPAGTAVRFEPGEEKNIELTNFGGNRRIFGFSNLTNGEINSESQLMAMEKARLQQFKIKDNEF